MAVEVSNETANPATCGSPSFQFDGPSHPDALKLLSNTTKRCLDASSYRVEAVQEHTWSNDFQRNWEKELLVAVVGPDGKYRYEATSGAGGTILVSDGKTHWNYHTLARAYSKPPPQVTTGEKTDCGIPLAVVIDAEGKILFSIEWATTLEPLGLC